MNATGLAFGTVRVDGLLVIAHEMTGAMQELPAAERALVMRLHVAVFQLGVTTGRGVCGFADRTSPIWIPMVSGCTRTLMKTATYCRVCRCEHPGQSVVGEKAAAELYRKYKYW